MFLIAFGALSFGAFYHFVIRQMFRLMPSGLYFKPFRVLKTETLMEGTAEDTFHSVKRITFELPNNQELGFKQPIAHVKIRRPDSWFKSRTYSVSHQGKGYFCVTVKGYRNGSQCLYLTGLKEGDVAYVNKTLDKPMSHSKQVGLIAYGIGIAEMLTTARDLLNQEIETRLVYCNSHQRMILYDDEIQLLKREYPRLFSVYHVLSREQIPNTLFGRLDISKLKEIFTGFDQDARFLVAGDRRTIRSTHRLLSEIGFSKKLLTRPNKPFKL